MKLNDLSSQLAKPTVKCCPCESTVEPVLQSNKIQHQKYISGVFIGNPVHHALILPVMNHAAFAYVPIESSPWPGLLPEDLVVAEQ